MGRPRIYATSVERTTTWKKAHPKRTRELNAASVKAWRAAHPQEAAAARRAERTRGLVSPEDYDQMVQEQMGLCAICGHAPIGSFHIDHDHVTGRVRGLLCRNCNLALGLFGDDVPALTRAVTYLVDARKAQESSDFKDKVGPVPGVLT